MTTLARQIVDLVPDGKPVPRPSARIAAIATAAPRHLLKQEDVAATAGALFRARVPDFDRFRPAYVNAGIRTRNSCVPLEWCAESHGWAERTALFVENALDLLEDAAKRCLHDAGIPAAAVDAVVAVSTTGIATPSLDARLVDRLGLRRDVVRLPIFGLGCAGGALGLARAADLARTVPGGRVLFLAVELCTLTFRPDDASKSNVIATALFGDGAAAVLIDGNGGSRPRRSGRGEDRRGSGAGPVVGASGEYTWPASLDVMGWDVADEGLGVVFSRDIPALIDRDLRPVADAFLARAGLRVEDLAGHVCHPGGTKVVDALERAFTLAPGTLAEERAVLRDHGNMSSVTVLHVLEKKLRRGLSGRHLLTALGPGFSAGFVLLEG
ncbi:MAG: type III polyketide synthase [Alphaproteobacteria bacterium]